MKIKFAVIIVDYKSMSETCNYIKKFCAMVKDYKDVCFVIIDNSNDVENYNVISKNFELVENLNDFNTDYGKVLEAKSYTYLSCNIIALRGASNAGYAIGNNLGVEYLRKVMKIEAKYILFSNNDIEFTNKISIDELLKPFSINPKIAVVGPHIIEKSGIQTSPRKKISIFKLLVLYNINLIFGNKLKSKVDDVEYRNNSGETYWVMGCFFIVDREKFEKVGMFDNDTFLYSEEMILSEKLLKKGFLVYYYNDIEVFHNHGKTINKHVESNKNVECLYYSHKICCKKYRDANIVELKIADIVFLLYKIQYKIKQKVKKLINPNGN